MFSPDRWPRVESSAVATGSWHGPVITADSTPHTKGAWVSLIAATAFDAYVCQVIITDVGASSVDTSMLIDIGYDPAAGTTYTVEIPNLLAAGAPIVGQDGFRTFTFPVSIPKGSQVAARCQSIVVSDTARVGIRLLGGKNRSNPFPHRGVIQDYGADTATSGGAAMVAASVDTKSTWVQLGADTTRRHSGLVVATGMTNGGILLARYLLDVGIDPAGGTSYTVVIPDVVIHHTAGEMIWNVDPLSSLHAIDIPAGSAIAARVQSENVNGCDRVDVAVYGF